MKALIFMVAALAGAGTPALARSVLGTVPAHGGRLVAISPQLPDGSLSTAEKDALTFDVLSDIGNAVARLYGLVNALPEELCAVLRSNNRALPAINGNESRELPVPATNNIARNGRAALAYLDVDNRKRLDPEAIVAGLRFADACSMSGACPDRNTRCGLCRFIRSFGIVQSASLQLISLHVALGSSLYRRCAGDVMRVPRTQAFWAWVRDGQSCSVIECPAPALPGHGEARKSAVSALADDEVLSDDKIAANARVHVAPEQIRKDALCAG